MIILSQSELQPYIYVTVFVVSLTRFQTGYRAHACNPRLWEVEARGSGAQGYPQLHREFRPA